jgi:AcrR family transcriptional regulator
MAQPALRGPVLPLDERLVEVTLELLAEEGLEGLSLRNVARRAGVSHAAPARHFRSLADLLAEVAARGFALLSEAMLRSDAQLPPRADVVTLMFRTEDLDVGNASFARDSRAAFDGLLHHVRACQASGWQAERDTRLLAGSMWAAVHGLATLWSQGAYQAPIPGASLEDALTTTLELVALDRQGGPR